LSRKATHDVPSGAARIAFQAGRICRRVRQGEASGDATSDNRYRRGIFGAGARGHGAFISATLYMVAQDQMAEADPAFWDFWIGLLLVLIGLFARGGVLGLCERLLLAIRRHQ
jgi:hypothetical protein